MSAGVEEAELWLLLGSFFGPISLCWRHVYMELTHSHTNMSQAQTSQSTTELRVFFVCVCVVKSIFLPEETTVVLVLFTWKSFYWKNSVSGNTED